MTIQDKEKTVIEKINENIFCDLEDILKNLNKRFNFKIYTILFSDEDKYQYSLRVRNTLAKNLKVNQEELQSVDSILRELNLKNDDLPKAENDGKSFMGAIKGYLDQGENVKKQLGFQQNETLVKECKEVESAMEEIAAGKSDTNNVDYQVVYSNSLKIGIDSKKYTIIYIIEIRNVDEEIMHIFYKNPQYSFLRMILDNFFYDYYKLQDFLNITSDEIEDINKRYNEKSMTFIRRMSRVFFGKIQIILKDGIKVDSKKINKETTEKEGLNPFDNKMDNRYYISNLLEEIDDISNKTYEGANPFGSILFWGKILYMKILKKLNML